MKLVYFFINNFLLCCKKVCSSQNLSENCIFGQCHSSHKSSFSVNGPNQSCLNDPLLQAISKYTVFQSKNQHFCRSPKVAPLYLVFRGITFYPKLSISGNFYMKHIAITKLELQFEFEPYFLQVDLYLKYTSKPKSLLPFYNPFQK